jgi:hypothetical protein
MVSIPLVGPFLRTAAGTLPQSAGGKLLAVGKAGARLSPGPELPCIAEGEEAFVVLGLLHILQCEGRAL